MTTRGKVLVLGAGLVARPLVRYLLDRGFAATVASRTVAKADALIDGHPAGRACAWTADRATELGRMVADHDLAVSLLPAPSHPIVAAACIAARKHMVTTSYVSPQMREYDAPARAAGLTFLNETGVDPGIDHMSIMRVIDAVRAKGGVLAELRSCCGGLPAPDANTNPFGYKFSWSPAGVLSAMTNPSRFREDGVLHDDPPGGLFAHVRPVTITGLGEMEYYPNRDSMSYIELYGLGSVRTMFRGTFRYPGWGRFWGCFWKVGLLDRSPRGGLAGSTWARVMADLVGGAPGAGLRERVAARAGVSPDDQAMDWAEWLGLFTDTPVDDQGTLLDSVAALMLAKMSYGPGERDMLLMQHTFRAEYPDGSSDAITSTMLDYGIPDGDSSMARTVSLPAAIATRLVLEGRITHRGVCIPVLSEIYDPLLDELEDIGIRLEEEWTSAR
jgi:saccharopine dehydrogenase-like NADP-dependent oxidoreductase